ncbi:MAG: ATP synthase F1 subunit delta [Planctomycetota bacterium]
MIESILAERYAKSLSRAAAKRGQGERIYEEFMLLTDILQPGEGEIRIPKLLAVLALPRIAMAEKLRVAETLLEELRFSEETGNFFKLLIRRRRIRLIGRIAEHYRVRTSAARGVVAADAESARPLEPEARERLRQALEGSLQGKVDLSVRVNRRLIGGVRLRMGGRLIDGSVSGALERLKNKLMH